MTASTDRPTPETDAFYRHRENLERVARIEVGTIAVKWGECGKHARRLERQRDALAEALRRIACYPATRSDEISIETARNLARDALAALERGDGKEADRG